MVFPEPREEAFMGNSFFLTEKVEDQPVTFLDDTEVKDCLCISSFSFFRLSSAFASLRGKKDVEEEVTIIWPSKRVNLRKW